MSDPGRTEPAKRQPKKKKKEGETLSKVIIGKLPLHKKGKKKTEVQEVPPISSPPPPSQEDAPVPESSQHTEEMKENDNVNNSEVSAPPEPQPPPAEEPPEKTSPVVENNIQIDEVKEANEVKEETKVNSEVEEVEKVKVNTAPRTAQYKAHANIKKECLYKILVIGELGTGKTSIIKRYVHQFFSQHYRATIGVDFALKVLNWDQNTIIRLQLWDIAGQERFGNMTRVYYKEAVGAFIVFDVTRASTFDAVVKWKQDLDAKVQLADGSPIPCVLLANKCDQQKEGIVNNPNKMNEYCEEHKFSGWFETSAKENINIEEAAKTLVDQIVRNDSSNENGRGSQDTSKFPLESPEEPLEKKSCAC